MNTAKNHDKTEKDEGFEFGERSVTPQNNSNVVCLPKIFTQKHI